jgi:PKD repeat protein
MITTKKGKKSTFGIKNPILIKKPNLTSKIIIDSHPAQIATVGDKVEFSLQTDGNPSHISWDFGTTDGIECDDRSCATVPIFFNTAGTYTIKAITTYKDLTTSIATTKLIVEDK